MQEGSADKQAVFIDFEGHINNPETQQLLEELNPLADEIKFSGSYSMF
jgi:prephenate dehydratase